MVDATFPARYIATSINASFEAVYAFASDPKNLPVWASGIGDDVEQRDGTWYAGEWAIEFAPRNELGVLDHTVTTPNGDTFFNPMRTFANGSGSEVVFTLYRLPGVDDAAFEADAATIAKDLDTLKTLLE